MNEVFLSSSTNIADIIIDTGPSASVCSVDVVMKWFGKTRPLLIPSTKRFRFGDSRIFGGLGTI